MSIVRLDLDQNNKVEKPEHYTDSEFEPINIKEA